MSDPSSSNYNSLLSLRAMLCAPSSAVPVKRSRQGRKDLKKENKHIIANVYRFFEDLSTDYEKARNINFHQVQQLTAEACGVSKTTVQRIKKDIDLSKGNEFQFSAPRQHYKREQKITGLSDLNKEVVRRSVISCYARGKYPTAETIRLDLVEKINFQGSKKSVLRILSKLGFTHKKCNDGKRILMERRNIASVRAAFLRKMHAVKNDELARPIYYLGETTFSENNSIALHVGSAKTGFLQECKFLLLSKKYSQTINNQDEMNATLFKRWFVRLLSVLKERSIIVMDNANCHSVLADSVPKCNWKKIDIKEWLLKHNISFTDEETRDELLSKREIKNTPKVYELDLLANSQGHEVIRLPQYHSHYNPINNIWAQIKEDVAKCSKVLKKITDIDKLVNDSIDKVTVEDWARYVRHAEALQEEDYKHLCIREKAIEPFVLKLTEDSSEESSSDYDSCEEDSDRKRRRLSEDEDSKTEAFEEIIIKEERVDDAEYSQAYKLLQLEMKSEEDNKDNIQIPDQS